MAIDLRRTHYEQSLSIVDGTGNAWDVLSFPGVAPILVRKDQGVIVATQTGSATGWRQIPDAPAPLYSTLLERPQISVKRDGPVKWVRTWTYVMAVAAGDVIDFAAAAAYPATMTFTDPPT